MNRLEYSKVSHIYRKLLTWRTFYVLWSYLIYHSVEELWAKNWSSQSNESILISRDESKRTVMCDFPSDTVAAYHSIIVSVWHFQKIFLMNIQGYDACHLQLMRIFVLLAWKHFDKKLNTSMVYHSIECLEKYIYLI